MPDYECPACGGGFPQADADGGCPWCGESFDASDCSGVSTPTLETGRSALNPPPSQDLELSRPARSDWRNPSVGGDDA